MVVVIWLMFYLSGSFVPSSVTVNLATRVNDAAEIYLTMTTLIALPIIRTKEDLETALKRLDVIIDAADGSLEAGSQ